VARPVEQQVRRQDKKPTKRPARPLVLAPPKPKNGFDRPLGRADAPLRRGQQQARKRVERAQQALPKRPVPAIPRLKNPTAAQRRAAQNLIRRSQSQALGNTKGADRQRQLEAYHRELRTDPRQRQYRVTAEDYARTAQRATEELLGRGVANARQKGAGDRLSASQARILGRQAIGYQQRRDTVRPRRPDTKVRLGPASINLTAAGQALASRVERGHGYGLVHNVPRYAGRVVSDAVNLPKYAALSLYETGAAGVEAAQGDTRRARRIIKGLDDGFVGQAVQGNFDEAYKQLSQHPLYSLLEVTGVGQIAGRGAGLAARSGALGGRARRFARQARPDEVLVPGTSLRVARRDSPNLIVQALRKGNDRSRRRAGEIYDVDGGEARARPVSVFGQERQDRKIRRAMDEQASQVEGERRYSREQLNRRMNKVGRGLSKDERNLVFMAVEGRISPTDLRGSMRAERARLQAAFERNRGVMSADAQRANRAQVKALDRGLSNSRIHQNPERLFDVARQVAGESRRLERDLVDLNALTDQQALEARLRPYAVSRMGARVEDVNGQPRLVRDGSILRPDEVLRHMDDNGVDPETIGFLGQRRDTGGARSFFVNFVPSRRSVDSKRRTGRGTELGAYATDFNAIVEDIVRRGGVTDAIRGFDELVNRAAVRKRDGTPFRWDEAVDRAKALEEQYGVEFVPVRMAPARYGDERLQQILGNQGPGRAPSTDTVERLVLGRATDEPPEFGAKQTANVVLVPKAAWKRIQDHQLNTSTATSRALNLYNRAFRTAVLPLSTKWMTGNALEGIVRSVAAGVSPRDVRTGRRVMASLRKMDEDAYKRADVQLRGGLLYGSADRMRVYRNADDFEGTALYPYVKAVEDLYHSKVGSPVRVVAGGLSVLTRGVFTLNRGIEQMFQSGVIGKQTRREVRDLTGSWTKALRLQREVIDEVAKGLSGTPKQVQFAREIDTILGKYTRFSPFTRRMVQTVAPFAPWFLSAAKFSFYTLPVHHPVKASLMASLEQTMRDDWDEMNKDAPPGTLRYAVRTPDGGYLDLARYTPFSIATEGIGITVEPFLPQFKSLYLNVRGQSWKERDFQLASGGQASDPKKVTLMMYSLLESVFPGLMLARRLREGGGTPYDDSTVFAPKTKPGSNYLSAPRRALDPFAPTYLRPPERDGGGTVVAPAAPVTEVDRIVEGARREAERQAREAQKVSEVDSIIDEVRRRAEAGR
jgi:hypothetical protein